MTLRERIEGLVAKLDHNSVFNNTPCSADDFTHQPEKCMRCQLAAALVAEGQGDVDHHYSPNSTEQRDCGNNACKRTWDGTLLHHIKHILPCTHIPDDEWLRHAAAPSLHKEGLPQATEFLIRLFLWEGHGHNDALYGDDGEMQCGVCHCDFKRDDLHECVEKARVAALEVGLKKMALHKEGAGGAPYSADYLRGYNDGSKDGAENTLREIIARNAVPLQRTLPDEQFKGAVVEAIERAQMDLSGDDVAACVRIFGLESVSLAQWRALEEWVNGLSASPAGRAEQEGKP